MAIVCLCLINPHALPAQVVDLNGNGLSDIWELLYGGSHLDPAADADGDGASNFLESIAGTNPFDSDSVPRLSVALRSNTNFVISIPGVLGKQYRLQSIDPLGIETWTNWITEAELVLRSGTNAAFIRAAGASARFFRIAISDVDTDGDGVSDWEEYKLGLDPTEPTSNGRMDTNGVPLGDYAFVTARLALQNVVSITAVDPAANQPDPSQDPVNAGLLAITRGGFPLNSITVNLGLVASGAGVAVEGVDYRPLPRAVVLPAGVDTQAVAITPLANTNRTAPVLVPVRLLSGSGYTLASAQAASVVIYPSPTPSGKGLTAQYFTNSSPTYTNSVNFSPGNLVLTRTDPVVDFNWSNNASFPITSGGYYTIRWTGQIQPEYSETYYFDANTDDGVKVWVNDRLLIDAWRTRTSADSIATITLQGGVRYNLRMDYFNGGGSGEAHLSWYSPSQPKQIVPARRLYPASLPPPPAVLTSALQAVAFLGQPFTFALTGANSPKWFAAVGLPPGLALDSTSGVIAGTPAVAGDFQATVTATNAFGVGASVLNVRVIDTGSSVARETWLNIPGTNIADIPLQTPPTTVNTLGNLEGITGFGQNYGERIRGYFTAPVTGNYYFWIAGSDSAELWISNDAEPANKVRRAYVSPDASTGEREWTLTPAQRSGWLRLVAGQPYYLEVLHKAGVRAGDNWSVGWRQDPTGTNWFPAGVVPGYVLARYYPPPPGSIPGTLYTANILAQAAANSPAAGAATLRVRPDGSRAVLSFNYSRLTSPVTGRHIHSDPYLNNPSQIIFDIDSATPQPDGSYAWNIASVGTLSSADILEIIREGKSYVNVHTVNYPAGEISGHFVAANGSPTFVPPPTAPSWVDDHTNASAAARFLIQATFGPTASEVTSVQQLGYEGWIDSQFRLPPTHHLPYVLNQQSADPTIPFPTPLAFNSWWQQSLTAPDQLRQRVAFAWSEIMVVSGKGVLLNNARALSDYYDVLLDNAFGNFRDLLEAVTLSPAMGLYLDMRGNDKGNLATGRHPNENYAREIL